MNNENKADFHNETLELLPWYVNESLTDDEQVRVMVHLRECEDCRAECEQIQKLQAVVKNETHDEIEISDYRFSFAKLMQRIDLEDAGSKEQEQELEQAPELGDLVAIRSPRSVSYLRWTAISVAASIVVGVFFMANIGQSDIAPMANGGVFQTFSEVSQTHTGTLRRLSLTFDESITPEELRSVLIEMKSNIVKGPENGVYIVDLSVPDNVTDSQFIKSIREIEGVKYAVYAETHTGLSP